MYLRPHPEERALARVSKDGRKHRRRVHPSRRLRSLSSGRAMRGPVGKLLRMRSVLFSEAAKMGGVDHFLALAPNCFKYKMIGSGALPDGLKPFIAKTRDDGNVGWNFQP